MARVPNVGDLQMRDVSLSTDPTLCLEFDEDVAERLFSAINITEDVTEYGSFYGADGDDSGWSFDFLRPKDLGKEIEEAEAEKEVLAGLDVIYREQAFIAAFTPPTVIEGYTPDESDETDYRDAFEPTASPYLPVCLREVLERLYLAHPCQEIRYRWQVQDASLEIRFVGLETAVYVPDRFTQAIARKFGKWLKETPITA